jgi:integrase
MTRVILTDTRIRALKPVAGKRIDVWDGSLPGFGVRVSGNKKTFICYARFNGAPSRRKIGNVDHMPLAKARALAREWLALVAQGQDPAALERERKGATFGAAMEDYLTRHVASQRRARVTEREIRFNVLPRWARRPLTDITKRDVIKLVDDIKDRGAPAQAHIVFGHVRGFFNWCIERDMLQSSPCDRLKMKKLIGPKKSRSRVLDDDEIRAYWHAACKLGYPYEPFYKLALLTGQRRGEIAGAQWNEFDLQDKLWTIPRERFKSDADHRLPLSDAAAAILENIPRWAGGGYLFSTTGGVKPIGNFGHAKTDLDDFMKIKKPFVLHDVRRTVRTNLAALRVSDLVAEMVIGHGKKGLARVYDQHRYLDEMHEALELWAARVRDIVTPPAANVTKLRRAL